MNEPRIPIPTIEETLLADAYEARMHFLYPDTSRFGRHITLPGQVTEPTAEAAQAELPFGQFPGLLMWVSFAKPEITGTVKSAHGERYATIHHTVGELAIMTYPGLLQSESTVLGDTSELNSFTKLWIGQYAMDRSKDAFGSHRHPLSEIRGIHKKANIVEELADVQRRAKSEQWDKNIDLCQWYVASLARSARAEFPELFSGRHSWQKRMGIRLRHPPVRK